MFVSIPVCKLPWANLLLLSFPSFLPRRNGTGTSAAEAIGPSWSVLAIVTGSSLPGSQMVFFFLLELPGIKFGTFYVPSMCPTVELQPFTRNAKVPILKMGTFV